MLHFRMTMPLYLMMISGSIQLLFVLFLRCFLKKKLPGYFFPILWGLVLIRFLVPFSLSSPLSLKVPSFPTSMQVAVSEVENTAALNATAVPSVSPDNAGRGSANLAVIEDSAIIDSYSYPISETTLSTSFQIAESAPSFYENGFLKFLRSAVYLLGIAITAGILVLQRYRCHIKLKNSLLIEHNEAINAILREMNLGHVLVFSNDEIASPLVCGLLMPRIYLPTRMDFQNQTLLQHILAHETMHIKRRDNWIKAAMLAVLCLNWFNPLVWLMAGCLASDLETACDEAALRICQDDESRKNYAFSLLAMAVTANRSPLFYSAFAKIEVEKRIQRILRYKKTSALMLSVVILLLAGSSVAFATGIQAPFSTYLSSTCYYGRPDSRWAFKVSLTRDIALGENPGERADNAILAVLEADGTGDPDLIKEQIREALAVEFHVEKAAFDPVGTLCIYDETETQEYAAWELTRNDNGIFYYQGEPVRSFTDEMNHTYQSGLDGALDIVVLRNRLGYISSVTVSQDGDIVRAISRPTEAY